MSFTVSQSRSVARALAAGAYILSDNDGTLAPFTASPDQTAIPAKTMAAIARLQAVFAPERFTIVTGRDLASIHGVLERSKPGAAASIPVLSDDGAVYAYGAKNHNNTTPAEQAFMAGAQQQVREYLGARLKTDPALYGLAVMEFKNNGININTNAVHAAQGPEKERRLRDEFGALFGELCEKSPRHGGAPGYALHAPAGYGLEIRSTRITKRQGIENLIKQGIVGKPLVLLVDDLKTGGNDVAAAQLVKKSGGIVIQVRREDPARACSDSERAVEPDITLSSPSEVAGFFRGVLKEYAQLKKPAAPRPKR